MSYLINAADEVFSATHGSLDNRVSRGFKWACKMVLYAIPGVVGAFIYFVGRVFKQGSCYYIKGKGEEVESDSPKVVSHNIARIWGAEKFDRLLARAHRSFERYDCDILLVQEAFGMEAYQFARIMRDQFAHIFIRPGGAFAGLDPGLAVFSKVPIEACQFFPFENRGRNFVSHGFMVVVTKDHVFINAHLDAKEDDQLHIRQFKEIEEKVKSLKGPIYICGDLNISGSFDRNFINSKLLGKVEGVDALHAWHRGTKEVNIRSEESLTSDHDRLVGQIPPP